MFSALRQGNPLYILEKGNDPSLKIGQIENVSLPKPKYTTYTPNLTLGMTPEMVVDITVLVDGTKMEFKQIPSNNSIANFDNSNIVISESREAMSAEIDGMLQTSKQILNSIDYHKKMIVSCEEMLKKISPGFAKEKDRDNAIESLTAQVNNMQTEFGSIRGDVSKILSLLAKTETK